MIEVPVVKFNAEHRLAVCRPAGRFDAQMAEQLLIYVMTLEDADPRPFKRLLDLRELLEIQLTGAEVCDIASARRMAVHGKEPVRTAILAVSPFAYSVASLYEELMNDSAIQVHVARTPAAAAEWLSIPLELIPED